MNPFTKGFVMDHIEDVTWTELIKDRTIQKWAIAGVATCIVIGLTSAAIQVFGPEIKSNIVLRQKMKKAKAKK
jgi:hypothetical protein